MAAELPLQERVTMPSVENPVLPAPVVVPSGRETMLASPVEFGPVGLGGDQTFCSSLILELGEGLGTPGKAAGCSNC